MCYSSIDASHSCEEKNIEICALQIEVRDFNVNYTCVYRAPSGNSIFFLRLLDTILKSVYNVKTVFSMWWYKYWLLAW